MKDEKEFSAVKNSIQTRLSGVMLLVLIFALGINVFIFARSVRRWEELMRFSSNTAIMSFQILLNRWKVPFMNI